MQKGGKNTTSKDIINEWKVLFNKEEIDNNKNDNNKCIIFWKKKYYEILKVLNGVVIEILIKNLLWNLLYND